MVTCKMQTFLSFKTLLSSNLQDFNIAELQFATHNVVKPEPARLLSCKLQDRYFVTWKAQKRNGAKL